MREIDVEGWERLKTYEWFKSFSNSTYSMNVKMDVTALIKHVKRTKESFFIDLLYLVVKGLNSIEEMRRLWIMLLRLAWSMDLSRKAELP